MLVQPRLRNHHAIAGLSMGTLCTARLITSRSPGRDATFVAAIMRMGVGDAVVDNFGANGIACPIEGQCGVLSGPAVRWTLLSPGQDRHPDTGVRLEGLKLPDWDAAVRLCLRAHGGLSTCPAVGWDVAFTPDGPVLMEGNMPFGIELTQFVTGLPLLTTTFMTAYLDAESHSRGALATERTDSAIRS